MKFVIAALLLLFFAPFSRDLDLSVSSYFYATETGFSTHPLWLFLYEYGPYLANITAGAALLLLIGSYFAKKLVSYRKIFLLLVLTLLIGSGLIAHGLLKDHWGRPRPRQITEFGGKYPFFPFYKPNFLGSQIVEKNADILRSFPCGHCTMGFYFLALGIAFRRLSKKRLSLFAYAFAFAFGILLSIARIAMGGHFLSDTLVAFVVMWLTAESLDKLIFRARTELITP